MDLNSLQTEKIIYLLSQKLRGSISAVEQADLDTWIAESEENKTFAEQLLTQGFAETEIGSWYAERTEAKLQVLKTQLVPHKPVSVKLRWLIRTAAAVAAIVFGVWFYNEIASLRKAPRNDEWVKNDIAPGKNTATLTINGGKAIALSEAKSGVIIDASQIKYNDGSSVGSPSPSVGSLSPAGRDGKAIEGEPKSLTLTTPRGGTYQVRLPDGTNVWLNAASSLTYATALNERGVKRIVKLSGEAYFEVAKMYSSSLPARGISSQRGERSSRVPFIVQSGQQEVEVLGTHFNVNAYKDEASIKTTLLEGSVKISSLPTGISPRRRERILKPGQQALVPFPLGRGAEGGEGITVTEADPNATAWVKGKFRFENTTLQDVMKQISRWYDVDVEYPNGIAEKRFSGDISRNNNLSDVLKVMKIMNLKFRVEGKKIIVEK